MFGVGFTSVTAARRWARVGIAALAVVYLALWWGFLTYAGPYLPKDDEWWPAYLVVLQLPAVWALALAAARFHKVEQRGVGPDRKEGL